MCFRKLILRSVVSTEAALQANPSAKGCFKAERIFSFISPDVQDRFWKYVDKDGPIPEHMRHLGKCWIWTGAKGTLGYGLLQVQGYKIRVHRISWVIHFSETPDNLNVLHKCDNPCCVNPSHLFLGTAKDNADDAVKKGRMAHGEKLSKLTKDDVIEIRKLRHTGMSFRKIAEQFSVVPSTIFGVVHGEWWKHL